jgi:glycosyltransferase involved in cell wall biosynthesis
VHIDTGMDFRGGQQALLTLARGLRERGHAQCIVSPAGSELERRARQLEFDVAELSLKELRARMRGADLLHAHTGRAQNMAFLASAGSGIKRIATRHVVFAPRHPLVHRLKYTSTCDGVIAVSQAVRRALLDAGVPADRIEVIPTGVKIPAELPDAAQRAEARRAWKLDDGDFAADFAVGHLGAFTHEKGQDVAAQAAHLLESRLPRLKMILAGEGPLGSSIAGSDRLILPGHVAEPRQLLAALDLFVMPSRSEGWGLAALEAMAFGLPVVASNTGGLAEMIVAGETGWLVAPGDASALADAIFEAARDRDRLHAMGLRARECARRFSVEQTAARTEGFYLRVLQVGQVSGVPTSDS